jgi:hypothetical protein
LRQLSIGRRSLESCGEGIEGVVDDCSDLCVAGCFGDCRPDQKAASRRGATGPVEDVGCALQGE